MASVEINNHSTCFDLSNCYDKNLTVHFFSIFRYGKIYTSYYGMCNSRRNTACGAIATRPKGRESGGRLCTRIAHALPRDCRAVAISQSVSLAERQPCNDLG